MRRGLREADAERDLEDLYRGHGDRLWRSVWLSTGSPEVADDAVAEAFAQALARGDELRDPLAWIWRTAFRIAAGEMKQMRATSPLSVDTAEPPTRSLVDLSRALARLSDRQRASLVLADYAGYSHREIAEILSVGRIPARPRPVAAAVPGTRGERGVLRAERGGGRHRVRLGLRLRGHAPTGRRHVAEAHGGTA